LLFNDYFYFLIIKECCQWYIGSGEAADPRNIIRRRTAAAERAVMPAEKKLFGFAEKPPKKEFFLAGAPLEVKKKFLFWRGGRRGASPPEPWSEHRAGAPFP